MTLDELKKELDKENRVSMEHIYYHITKMAKMCVSTIDFEGTNERVYNDISKLTSREAEVLRGDGYIVSWNKFTSHYTVSGW